MAAQAPPRDGETDMEHTAPTPRTDTRSRVQQVALELFAEQGYEKTSLREIAERLDVTKAALYYHFKTKEDILSSVAEDLPHSLATKQELLRRYSDILWGSVDLFRFIQENQATVRELTVGENFRT